MTNQKDLIRELSNLSKEALVIGEAPAASVLLALCGALAAGLDRELMNLCAVHAQSVIDRIHVMRATPEEWPDEINIP